MHKIGTKSFGFFHRRILQTSLLLIVFLPLFVSLPAQEEPTLAVVPIYSIGVDKTRVTILYDYIIDQINRTKAFALVERAAIDKALSEIKFSMKEIIDEKTAARLGKISGARYILIPALYLAEGTFHLSMRIVETDSARIKNTSVKTTGSFKNVESLAAEATQALLGLGGGATNTAVLSTAGKNLGGNSYFFDDRGTGGSSTIDTGIAKDGVITLRGSIIPGPRGAYLGAGMEFDEKSTALLKRAKGIRLKAEGDNQYYSLEVQTRSVTIGFYSKLVFIPDRGTEVVLMFSELRQPHWGKKAAFSREEITGISFVTFSHRFDGPKASLIVKDIAAVTDDEKWTPEGRVLSGSSYTYDDQGLKGTSTVGANQYTLGFLQLEGRITNVLPYGFIGTGINFDEASRRLAGKARGIAFRIAGDGKEYLCMIKTSQVKDFDYYQIRVKPGNNYITVAVLFHDLKQRGSGKTVAFDRNGIEGIEFQTIGQPWPSVRIQVADIEYIPD